MDRRRGSKAWIFVKPFGRNGARIVDGIIGSLLLVLGLLFVFGVTDPKLGAR